MPGGGGTSSELVIARPGSTCDGLALAWAICEHLALRIRCRALFATHYHELTELESLLDATTNLNVAVREWADEVIFLHKIVKGGTDRSYGVHVARLAGVPRDVIDRKVAKAATSRISRKSWAKRNCVSYSMWRWGSERERCW